MGPCLHVFGEPFPYDPTSHSFFSRRRTGHIQSMGNCRRPSYFIADRLLSIPYRICRVHPAEQSNRRMDRNCHDDCVADCHRFHHCHSPLFLTMPIQVTLVGDNVPPNTLGILGNKRVYLRYLIELVGGKE